MADNTHVTLELLASDAAKNSTATEFDAQMACYNLVTQAQRAILRSIPNNIDRFQYVKKAVAFAARYTSEDLSLVPHVVKLNQLKLEEYGFPNMPDNILIYEHFGDFKPLHDLKLLKFENSNQNWQLQVKHFNDALKHAQSEERLLRDSKCPFPEKIVYGISRIFDNFKGDKFEERKKLDIDTLYDQLAKYKFELIVGQTDLGKEVTKIMKPHLAPSSGLHWLPQWNSDRRVE